jgi:hypothetical protein
MTDVQISLRPKLNILDSSVFDYNDDITIQI